MYNVFYTIQLCWETQFLWKPTPDKRIDFDILSLRPCPVYVKLCVACHNVKKSHVWKLSAPGSQHQQLAKDGKAEDRTWQSKTDSLRKFLRHISWPFKLAWNRVEGTLVGRYIVKRLNISNWRKIRRWKVSWCGDRSWPQHNVSLMAHISRIPRHLSTTTTINYQ